MGRVSHRSDSLIQSVRRDGGSRSCAEYRDVLAGGWRVEGMPSRRLPSNDNNNKKKKAAGARQKTSPICSTVVVWGG